MGTGARTGTGAGTGRAEEEGPGVLGGYHGGAGCWEPGILQVLQERGDSLGTPSPALLRGCRTRRGRDGKSSPHGWRMRPAGKLRALEIPIIRGGRRAAPGALSRPRQLFRPHRQLHPPPTPPQIGHPPASRAVPGPGRASPEPTSWCQEVEENTPPPISTALLSLQGDPQTPRHWAMEAVSVLSPSSWEKRRAWARQSRCWRNTAVEEEEVAAAMQDVPELQPPHLDDVFLEGRGDPGVQVGRGSLCAGLSHRCFCPPLPGSPSSKIETWLQECG